MDYKEIMKEEVEFSKIYEQAMINLANDFELGEELKEKLSNKRDFGLKKYGEFSFQSNFENCITSPTLLHAEEEMIDLFNYLLHEYYKQTIIGDNQQAKKITKLIYMTQELYEKLISI